MKKRIDPVARGTGLSTKVLPVGRAKTHFGAVLNRGPKSPQNHASAGLESLRYVADIPVRGFGRLSGRPTIPGQTSQPRKVSKCARRASPSLAHASHRGFGGGMGDVAANPISRLSVKHFTPRKNDPDQTIPPKDVACMFNRDPRNRIRISLSPGRAVRPKCGGDAVADRPVRAVAAQQHSADK